jgi:adenine-specific DNA methylase|tara:strand:+ start:256 stop:621 length:366 start_codon:yes stop_codon:yes gene_type:complete
MKGYKMKESLKVLQKAAEIQTKKGNDYQNPNSRVRQADYYPRGCATLLDTMYAKVLRMQSVLEAMEQDPDYNPNFESLEDSCIDIINYASFFAAYMKNGIDGQDPDRDFLNRPKKENANVD